MCAGIEKAGPEQVLIDKCQFQTIRLHRLKRRVPLFKGIVVENIDKRIQISIVRTDDPPAVKEGQLVLPERIFEQQRRKKIRIAAGEGRVYLRLPACQAPVYARILHTQPRPDIKGFESRTTLDIPGVYVFIINEMLAQGFIRHPAVSFVIRIRRLVVDRDEREFGACLQLPFPGKRQGKIHLSGIEVDCARDISLYGIHPSGPVLRRAMQVQVIRIAEMEIVEGSIHHLPCRIQLVSQVDSCSKVLLFPVLHIRGVEHGVGRRIRRSAEISKHIARHPALMQIAVRVHADYGTRGGKEINPRPVIMGGIRIFAVGILPDGQLHLVRFPQAGKEAVYLKFVAIRPLGIGISQVKVE